MVMLSSYVTIEIIVQYSCLFFFFAVEVGVEDIDDLLKITLLIQGHAVQMCIRA